MHKTECKNREVFLALLRAGFWEKEVRLSQFKDIDFGEVLKLAEGQSVVGLIAAGLEHVVDIKVPKKDVLAFIGLTMQLEQRNMAMNYFIAEMVEEMYKMNITTVLAKGQGIAQCYERPLWRTCGDVDFFLDSKNYEKAKTYLKPLAKEVEEEDTFKSHLALIIKQWVVELHGSMKSRMWSKLELAMDSLYYDIFKKNKVRHWQNGSTDVILPGVDEDAFYIFAHFVCHFFKGGIGLRQICDWCRLLWVYQGKIDKGLLEKRLLSAGLMSEWKVFASFAVEYLAMPVEAMPLYAANNKWKLKASRVMEFIWETGNFGHNRDNSRYQKHSYVVYKAISFWRNNSDTIRHFLIFPKDATLMWRSRLKESVRYLVRGK